jgi:hypothetical protein
MVESEKTAIARQLLGKHRSHSNKYGNEYADYNRQTVVVGVFYMVLLKLWKARDLPDS